MQPELVEQHPFIDRWREKGYQYYIISKQMLHTASAFGLGMDEVVLYTILRSRTSLSFKNNWVDKDNHVYIIYTREDIAAYTGWSMTKTKEVFHKLAQAGLLTEKKQEKKATMYRPNLLYVHQWIEPSFLRSIEEIKRDGFPLLTEKNIFPETSAYYVLPCILLEDERYAGVPLRAILLYMIALDSLHLSLSYGQVDENGLVWCRLDSKAVCRELGCHPDSLTAAYKSLETIGLMVRVREKGSQLRRIYLRDYLPPPDTKARPQVSENPTAAIGKSDHGNTGIRPWLSEDSTTGIGKSDVMSPEKAAASYPCSQTDSDIISQASIGATAPEAPSGRETYQECLERYRGQVEYERLKEDILCCSVGLKRDITEQEVKLRLIMVDMCLSQMAKDASNPGLYIRFGNRTEDREMVVWEYDQIDRPILFTLIAHLSERWGEVKNKAQYLHAALATAADDHGGASYYTEEEIKRYREEKGLPYHV